MALLFALGCSGGQLELPQLCNGSAPTPSAVAKVNEIVNGGVVLPNGRLVFPAGTSNHLELGHPVDMIARPSSDIVYVADARYDGADPERCAANDGRQRGLHVIELAPGGPVEKQSPEQLPRPAVPQGVSGAPQACKDGTFPADGAFGLAITRDGSTLYASTGVSGYVVQYHIENDGRLGSPQAAQVGGFTAGLTLSPDESELFVVRFLGEQDHLARSSIAELKVAANASDAPKVVDSVAVKLHGYGAYALAAVQEPAGLRLWASGFRAGTVQTVLRKHGDPDFGSWQAIDVGKNPEGIVPYDGGVIVAVSDADKLVRLEYARERLLASQIPVGNYLPASCGNALVPSGRCLGASPSQLVVKNGFAYTTLAADNSVSIVDLAQHREVGVVSVGVDPSALAFVGQGARSRLVVANGKTHYGPQCPEDGCPTSLPPPAPPGLCRSGTPASRDAAQFSCTRDQKTLTRDDIRRFIYFDAGKQQGNLSIVPQDTLDHPADATAQARRNLENPVGRYPSGCEKNMFPVPASPGMPTPIKHVMLVVRENKTYDFLLGDLPPDGDGNPRDGDPALAVDAIRASHCLPPITRNLHALADRFTSLDNFYDDSEVSTQGHSWLTRDFVNDYLERIHLEENDSASFGFAFDEEPGLPGAEPGFGSFFTHLLSHGITFTIYGEITGALGQFGDSFVANHIDFDVPPNNLDVSDLDRVKTIDKSLDKGDVPAFMYVLLPRDHTKRLEAGKPSPVSMIAENDVATGKLIEHISRKPDLWRSTVIFIVEDDPQQGYDHVDYHRSICLVVGPWARAGHNSSQHASYPALFHTIEAILGLPPMNRFDANAPILWDAFQANPPKSSFAPYDAENALVPLDALNPNVCATPAEEETVTIDDHPDTAQVVWKATTTAPAFP